jgi:hypothetical protein
MMPATQIIHLMCGFGLYTKFTDINGFNLKIKENVEIESLFYGLIEESL